VWWHTQTFKGAVVVVLVAVAPMVVAVVSVVVAVISPVVVVVVAPVVVAVVAPVVVAVVAAVVVAVVSPVGAVVIVVETVDIAGLSLPARATADHAPRASNTTPAISVSARRITSSPES
jgi:hypothetical protein